MASLAIGAPEAAGERVVLWMRVGGRSPASPALTREAAAAASARSEELIARSVARGGALEAQLSGQIIVSFDAHAARDAIELCLELFRGEADDELAIAIASSPVLRSGSRVFGDAFDDAWFLAGRAKPGELVLDGSLRDRLPGVFLYSRRISQGGLRAAAIDRRHPRRADVLRSLPALGPAPLVAATRTQLLPLVEAAKSPGSIVVLEGPVGAGAGELIDEARRIDGAPRALVLGAASGRLAVLESLRLGLARAPSRLEAHAALVRGELRPMAEVLDVLDDVLGEERAWIVLNPAVSVDDASLEAVARLRARRGTRLTLVIRLPVDAPVPPTLGRAADVRARLMLPALRTADAREVVASLLDADATSDVVRRVATLGGDSTLGCEEAARLLVASGELVRDEGAFGWRTTPRGGVEGIGVEELSLSRLDLLDDDARRLLELVCVAPRGASATFVRALALLDGMPERAMSEAFLSLEREGWFEDRGEPTTHFLRRVVQSSMPPARLAELHRFAARSLPEHPLHALTLPHFVESGQGDVAEDPRARALARTLLAAGFTETARKMERASEVAPSPEGDEDEEPDETAFFSSDALRATLRRADAHEGDSPNTRELHALLRARDVDGLERWIERATLLGADHRALARLRALADILRGDLANAEARLGRASDHDDPKTRLAHAMVVLGAGRSAEAARHALAALAWALREGDERGRSAAYHALAACYRLEGREDDARELLQRA